ncbi:hypothetical protein PoB_000661000 [Plakobranchus ocellatus]|uniref:Uncharacterized protein n=1 Tax=Plakobranchus ocellatus TaxID=259542 RepID=A0AAV3YAM8_9GAST|nr:hypothetical protein PoB_000661000 [Plakobranchus ocellatus]
MGVPNILKGHKLYITNHGIVQTDVNAKPTKHQTAGPRPRMLQGTLSASLNFAPSEQLAWLTDNDDRTCNDGSRPVQSITVSLDTPRRLSWVRVMVNESGRNLTLEHFTTQSDTFQNFYSRNAVVFRIQNHLSLSKLAHIHKPVEASEE